MIQKYKEVIQDFGKEWSRFTQVDSTSQYELDNIYNGFSLNKPYWVAAGYRK